MPRHVHLPVLDPATMPKTRADCLEGGRNEARPCPWLCCRHNLAADGAKGESCVLDVLDRRAGEALTLEGIGQMLGLTRERIRQLEAKALGRLRRTKAGRAALAELAEHLQRDP